MASGVVYNIEVSLNASLYLPMNLQGGSPAAGMNLAGWTAKMDIRQTIDSTSPVLELTTTPTPNGSVIQLNEILITGNTHSNTLVDQIFSTVGLAAGQPITGTGVNTTIANPITNTTLTLSSAASTSTTNDQLTVTVLGQINIAITQVDMQTLLVGSYVYDLVLTSPATANPPSQSINVMGGTFTVDDGVSKPTP